VFKRTRFSRFKKGWFMGSLVKPDVLKKSRINFTRRNVFIFFSLICGTYGLAYAFSTEEAIPFVGRNKRVMVPHKYEKMIGDYYRSNFLRRHAIVHPDHELVKHIEEIGNKITRDNGLPDHEYILIDSNEVNAFVFPGNTVFVFKGILPFFGNDSAAALVLSHEIGHVVAGHAMFSLVYITPLVLLSNMIGGSILRNIVHLFISLPFSRENEIEADSIGLYMTIRSCYLLKDSLIFFQNMKEHGGEKNEWTSTHPSWSNRIKNLEEIKDKDDFKTMQNTCQRSFHPKPYYMFKNYDYSKTLPHISFNQYKELRKKRLSK